MKEIKLNLKILERRNGTKTEQKNLMLSIYEELICKTINATLKKICIMCIILHI